MGRRSGQFVAIAVLAVLVPVWALAGTVYYVSPTGTESGLSPSTPASLAWANANVQAGDVVIMQNGSYNDPIQVIGSRNGTSTAPITFKGNQSYPESVVVPRIVFAPQDNWPDSSEASGGAWHHAYGGSWMSVKWVKCTGVIAQPAYLSDVNSPNYWAAVGDTLYGCQQVGSRGLDWSGMQSVIDHCSFTLTPTVNDSGDWDAIIVQMIPHFSAPTATETTPARFPTTEYRITGQVVRNSTFSIAVSGAGTVGLVFWECRFVDNSRFYGNTYDFRNSMTGTNIHKACEFTFYQCSNNYFADNRIRIHDYSASTGTRATCYLRDYSRFNQFLRDSMALPGIVWVHLRPDRGAGRVEVESAAVEVDRHLEALATAEAA